MTDRALTILFGPDTTKYPLQDSEIAAIREFRGQVDVDYPIPVWRAVVDALLGHEAAVRPEVQALRDRVKALEQLLNSLMEPTKTTFGATLEGEATG